MTKEDRLKVIRARWFAGDLRHLLRKHGQKWLYEDIAGWKAANPKSFGPFVALCHRRMGKSTSTVEMCLERCLRKPANALFLAPLQQQVESIVKPILNHLLRGCPMEIQLRWRRNQLRIRNPAWKVGGCSTFTWMGADRAGGRHIRGLPSQNLIVCDEAGFIENLDRLVDQVLVYLLHQQEDPALLMVSTPSESLAHPFIVRFLRQAEEAGTYRRIRASENPDFTWADRKAILEAIGKDENSIAYQREAECELVQDEDSSTVPEYGRMKSVVEVAKYKRPAHWLPLISVDLGYIDETAVLAGYVDFAEQILVIEGEWVQARANSKQVGQAVRGLEEAVFAGNLNPPFRYMDAPPMVLDDFYLAEQIRFRRAETHDPLTSLAKLRSIVAEGRLRILPGCPRLRYQMLTGTLRKSTGGAMKLSRTQELSHQDAIAALIYMARMAPWGLNPIPMRGPLPRLGALINDDQAGGPSQPQKPWFTREPAFARSQVGITDTRPIRVGVRR